MEQVLTKGKIFPTLMKFALPFLIANFLQLLYGAVDLLVVGQFCDAAAVSAVATGSQVMKTITGIVTGLTTGGTVLIGQFVGAGKREEAAKTVGTMVSLFAVVSIVLTAIMLVFSTQIAILLSAPEEAFSQTVGYIFICSIGIVFIVGYNAVSGILRGMGDSKSPMIFVMVACFVNVGLDLIFVGVLHMGAQGAALATILAQATSFVFALIYLKIRGFGLPVTKKDLKPNKQKAKGILRFGSPIALQDALINISFLIITAILNIRGLVASAAGGVVENVLCFAMLPPLALSMAVAAMTAQNIGAGEIERAKKCMGYAIWFTLAIEVLFTLFVEFGDGHILLAIFTNETAVIDQAYLYLKSYAFDCVLVCFIFCMNGFFNGCGKTLFSMTHSLIATFVFRVPLAYLFSTIPTFGLYEIGLAAPLASFVSVVLCLIYFKSNKWQTFGKQIKKSCEVTK